MTSTHCLWVRSPELEAAGSPRVRAAFPPAPLALALPAYAALAQRHTAVERQGQLKSERAESEAPLAQRRYDEGEPAKRLVAATLAQRWHTALEEVEAVKPASPTPQQPPSAQELLSHRAAVLAWGTDLPRLGNAPTPSAKDRKRRLRLVLTAIPRSKAAKAVTVPSRGHGGATDALSVPLRPTAADHWRHDPALGERVRELAPHATEEQRVAQLNQAGVRTRTGNPLTVAALRWMRFTPAIPVPTLKRAEARTGPEVAAPFGVSRHVVYYGSARHQLPARKLATPTGRSWFLTIDPQTEHRLRQWVAPSSRLAKGYVSQTLIVGGAV